MIVKLYSIYDVKAEVYEFPYPSLNDGTAIRTLSEVVMDERTKICKYPEDYKLFCIGEFDDQQGKVIDNKNQKFVIDAFELRR